MKTHSVLLRDEQEHIALAENVASKMESMAKRNAETAFVIFLEGDLGTGKTSFARGFIHGSGYDGTVRSPTYTLVEPYPISVARTCYHFDLYRLAEPEELEFTGARDYFNDKDICLVEWPEKAQGYLPQPDWYCRFDYMGQGRQLHISSESQRGDQLMLQVFPDE